MKGGWAKESMMKKKECRYSHLACLSDTYADVENIMKRIEGSRGVILYFHGGLSSQKYMKKDLAPKLMESIFSAENLNGLYPVFINYDAGFLDKDNWCCLLRNQDGLKKYLKKAKKYFKKYFKSSHKKNTLYNEKNIARKILDDALEKQTKSMRKKRSLEAYLDILENPKLQKDIGEILIRESTLEAVRKNLQKIADAEHQDKGIANTVKVVKALARSMARIAIGNNHQIVPTLEEEFFRAFSASKLSIDYLAKMHWHTVKEHSKQCNAKKSVENYLISRLLEKKGRDKDFTINTVSHSAGAIPTAHLIKQMKKKKQKLDTVIMIVPAINQEDFSKLVMANEEGFRKLKLYVLDLEAEEKDTVGKIYPASLLYFVSGTAEEKGYGDKMLLIAQHLDPRRKPYANDGYLKRVQEYPKKVWTYVAKNPILTYCPSQLNVPSPEKELYSHSTTKKPWITQTLARDILFHLTGEKAEIDVTIKKKAKKQRIDKKDDDCAEVKCLK